MMSGRNSVRKLTAVALFTALLTASAFLRIPLPPVPVTLQAQVAMLCGCCLGGIGGLTATALYLLLGLLGLPVFAGGGGIAYVFQPTFGYLLGFCFGSLVCGVLSDRFKAGWYRIVLAQLAGLVIIYLVGITWFLTVSVHVAGSREALYKPFLISAATTLPVDFVLTVAFSVLVKRMHEFTKRYR